MPRHERDGPDALMDARAIILGMVPVDDAEGNRSAVRLGTPGRQEQGQANVRQGQNRSEQG